MSQEIEIEFKNLLTKDEYNILLKELPFPFKGTEQINYYFETPVFQLREHGAALRIREKNGEYRLTLKEPFGDALLETHDKLTKTEATEWINGNPIIKENTTKQLQRMNIQLEGLKYFGSLTTLRREYKENELIYVLDHSKYLKNEDFEFEIEAIDKESGIKALEEVLKRFGITRKNTPNKIARFFQAHKEN